MRERRWYAWFNGVISVAAAEIFFSILKEIWARDENAIFGGILVLFLVAVFWAGTFFGMVGPE